MRYVFYEPFLVTVCPYYQYIMCKYEGHKAGRSSRFSLWHPGTLITFQWLCRRHICSQVFFRERSRQNTLAS